MSGPFLRHLTAAIDEMTIAHHLGRVSALGQGGIAVSGLARVAALGDRVEITCRKGHVLPGEIRGIGAGEVTVLADGPLTGIALADEVRLLGEARIAPDDGWLGRVIDPMGRPMDGRPLRRGPEPRRVESPPPAPARRKSLGPRLETGLCAFNTMLPLVRGQRVGLFAGSGVGKSSLISGMARGVAADVVVLALIGERGRELRHFVQDVLGPEGMARTVVVAATSDQSPLTRRRCAWTAMSVAEHFRNRGRHVLLLADSVTRFAEAHREVALALGEPPTLGGYPPSLAHAIMTLAERAGPGEEGQGDITAVFSVLVAGSDMDGPVADILRGVLDGHVVLERDIAERGRFPAINLLKSVSRSLPDAASPEENAVLQEAREMLGVYDRAELMIQSGLYTAGSSPQIDRAITLFPRLDAFISEPEPGTIGDSFQRLRQCLGKPG
ncbi:FliI/YscN family ATPase [Mangrovicoccus algicola]|uniref:FliI/YscN family ATPase n=1 Tax=Mangrovicoccus algicola TaxID=2771008 RepID=A0A8J7D116_9RHOB|nr:FliI/YscN family ATPase [Mangrovicoccus algicola]MBE3640228.1 FliI/YscN family ATPase [Mangrovicoccus algicola]